MFHPNCSFRFRGFLRALTFCLALVLAAGCASSFKTPNGGGYYASSPLQCVPYARSVSGIDLYGDAYTWWDKAGPLYAQGRTPRPGAVLVLSRTERMRHGHLAVVTKIIGPREIEVTHSNWGSDTKTRRIIYEYARAKDVSALNDWSQISFWNYEHDCFGTPYKAEGFIYK